MNKTCAIVKAVVRLCLSMVSSEVSQHEDAMIPLIATVAQIRRSIRVVFIVYKLFVALHKICLLLLKGSDSFCIVTRKLVSINWKKTSMNNFNLFQVFQLFCHSGLLTILHTSYWLRVIITIQ